MNTLKAQTRDMETKAKRLRREGYITGNLFGKEIKGSIPVKIERNEVDRVLKHSRVGNQITLDVEGKVYDVLIKELDYDSLKNKVLEIDFQALVSGEKVHTVAEIILNNKEKVMEGILEQLINEISYKALPVDLVDKIVIDVGSLRVGDLIKVRDLDIANNENIDLITNPDATVAHVIFGFAGSSEETKETTEK